MKRNLSRFMSVTLAGALALGLTACGGSNASSQNTDTSGVADSGATTATASSAPTGGSGESSNLNIMWWGSNERHEATLKAIELYEELNPQITFTPEYTGWDGYWNKLPVLTASDTLPDILQMDAQFIASYIKNNELADLSSIDLDGIVDPEVLENLKVDGKLYAIPLALNGAGIAYNKTALEAAGVTLPKEGWTWDDLFAFIDEAHEKLPEGTYPMFELSENYELYQFYQAAMGGGPVIQDDKLDLDRELFFSMQERMNQYRKEGKVPTAEETISLMENDPQMDLMVTGKLMLFPKTVASVGALNSLMPDSEIGIVNWPTGPNAGGWAQSTIFFCVAANSPHIEEAKEFIRWFISDPKAGETLMTVRGLPISDEVYSQIEPLLKPADVMGKTLYEVAAANNPRPFYPSSAQFVEFVARPSGTYKSTIEMYMFGQITLEEAYEKLIAAGQKFSGGSQ